MNQYVIEWADRQYEQAIEEVRLTDLKVLPYARELIGTHAILRKKGQGIGFTLAKCDPPLAVRRPDGIWLADGLHRIVGAQRTGLSHLVARVIVGDMPDEDLAKLSYELQMDSRRLDAVDALYYRQAAGDTVAVALLDLVTQYGFVFRRGGSQPTTVRAAAAFEHAWKVDQGHSLEQYLRLITELPQWAEDGDRVEGRLVYGITLALGQKPQQVSYDVVRGILAVCPPEFILIQASVLAGKMGKAVSGSGSAPIVAMWIRQEADRRINGRTSHRVEVSVENEGLANAA